MFCQPLRATLQKTQHGSLHKLQLCPKSRNWIKKTTKAEIVSRRTKWLQTLQLDPRVRIGFKMLLIASEREQLLQKARFGFKRSRLASKHPNCLLKAQNASKRHKIATFKSPELAPKKLQIAKEKFRMTLTTGQKLEVLLLLAHPSRSTHVKVQARQMGGC